MKYNVEFTAVVQPEYGDVEIDKSSFEIDILRGEDLDPSIYSMISSYISTKFPRNKFNKVTEVTWVEIEDDIVKSKDLLVAFRYQKYDMGILETHQTECVVTITKKIKDPRDIILAILYKTGKDACSIVNIIDLTSINEGLAE